MKNKTTLTDAGVKAPVTDKGRRKAIIGTVSGITAATIWARPVVDSVILPAHAATTDATGSGGPSVTTTLAPAPTAYYTAGSSIRRSAAGSPFSPQEILELIVPTAHAGDGSVDNLQARAVSTGGDNWRVDIRNNQNTLTRGGTGQLGTPFVLAAYEGVTGRCGPFSDADSFVATIDQITDAEFRLSVEHQGEIVLQESSQNLTPLDNDCVNGSQMF